MLFQDLQIGDVFKYMYCSHAMIAAKTKKYRGCNAIIFPDMDTSGQFDDTDEVQLVGTLGILPLMAADKRG